MTRFFFHLSFSNQKMLILFLKKKQGNFPYKNDEPVTYCLDWDEEVFTSDFSVLDTVSRARLSET